MELLKEVGTLALATRMQKLGDAIRKEASQIYKEHGIDFESKWFPVVYVLSKKSPMSVMELTNELGYAHPSVIALVKELQNNDLVASAKDKKDGRKRMLALTRKACIMVEKMNPLWEMMQRVNTTIIDNQHNLLQAIEEAEAQIAYESFYVRMQKLLMRHKGDIIIKEFDAAYQDNVVDHIQKIENDEFDYDLTLEDQPDLISIEKSYQLDGGNFWIALDEDDAVIGTIGLYNLGDNIGYLRKMFVRPKYRGRHTGLSKKLLDVLLEWAVANKFERIYLETTAAFIAARKFYLKHGFKPIDREDMPDNIPIVKVAEYFFAYDLKNTSR